MTKNIPRYIITQKSILRKILAAYTISWGNVSISIIYKKNHTFI